MTTTPCVIYAAKSTADTRGSIPTQLADCRAMAERKGWEVVGEFQDEAASGYSGNRGPGLEAAIDMAVRASEEHGSSVLAAQHSDRFARGDGRKARHLGGLYFPLLERGVDLRTAQDDDNMRDAIRVVLVGERNTEDSKRKSQAVKSGKDRQMQRGEWLGGPAPDGYVCCPRLDERGDKKSRLELDPEREPVIRTVFDLSRQGLGDATVARKLNAAGHRTKAGKAWTRRRVQSTLRNPAYAGRVSRRTAGGKALAEPEVVPATNVPALIDPEVFDQIAAARAARDRSADGRAKAMTQREKAKRGGRPTLRFALSRLAVCDRCGSPMYCVSSPYKRKTKGGTRARRYQCPSYHDATAVCDQPPLDAEKIDAAIVAYLDGLFIDYEAFVAGLSRGADQERSTIESALLAALGQLDQADGTAGKIEADYIRRIQAGEDTAADVAARALERVKSERLDSERRVEECRQRLTALEDRPHDAALDAYNALKRAVSGGDGDGLGELNERLRNEFEEFRLDRMEDGTVGVVPVLRERPFTGYAGWAEAGKPLPSEDEARRIKRGNDTVAEGLWITGEERIRPPAKPLRVVDGNPPHSHE